MNVTNRRIADLSDQDINQTVCLRGWVRTRRDSKAGLSFIQLHDGSGFAAFQVVASSELENYTSEISRVTSGCSIKATGMLVASQGKGQSLELQASAIEVVGWVENPDTYPVQPKAHSMEYLREVAHLRPRTNTFGAVARIRHYLAQAIHSYFADNGFLWVHTPIITTGDAEGAGEMFRVSTLDLANLPRTESGAVDTSQDFFGRDAFLTVSGQLNVEAYCLALDKVYTFGPTFRAENSNTSRHLAEFWMIEPEIAFADLNDIAVLADNLIKHALKVLLNEREDDLAFFNQRIDTDCLNRLQRFVDTPVTRMSYTDAVAILESSGQNFEFPVSWGIDLSSEHERWLCEQYVKGPVVVQDYPKDIKAFYMRVNDDGNTVAAMDLLAPGIGEIVGGAQREERLPQLDARMDEVGVDKDHLDWYRDLRRYGSVPHAGFGLGFERLVVYATGLGNVRDAIPYPRTPRSAPF